MKRILVFLLALCAIAAFAACDKTPTLEPTEPVFNTDDYTTTEAPPTETEPPEETTEPIEETTEAQTPDLTAMDKEQLVQYYNDAVNAVRAVKPAYTREERLKINDFKSSILGGMLDGLLKDVVKKAMPGDPVVTSKKQGESNVDHFFIEQEVSAVNASDLKSITARKEGSNYVITLTLGNEVNPARKGASRYSRVFQIQTRQDVLDNLAGNGLNGSVDRTTLTYRDGRAVVTINENGQIIRASTEFFVDATSKQAKLSIFTFDLTAYQQSNWEYTNFVY
ncbi:MAG: hypothetical protein FWF60_08755 [Oscillospiraceae bacterium]|nr:hypothetical protein [Oscillospiraceae bacterium]